ncbi:L,D-transpeptidase family protein [Nocardioides sp. TF02-7]|uniref:L,D-transpeptidase family protein n=1 Tax=Nocardioides sp. TF02-7 TaxID=2917724 RepID=UPI001F05ECF8|nr:L,D-transpeptidase family protein [Nocardioides sp. TF02-7]UMG93830.1 L,D-transpeptidase family protein [Nocardioides sp. TF02-7]
MSIVRRLTVVAVVAALCCALAYGVGRASHTGDLPWEVAAGDGPTVAADRHGGGGTTTADDAGSRRDGDRPARPEQREQPEQREEPEEPALVPGPTLVGPGDSGRDVRELQARLAQIDWFAADVTGFYGDVTTEAVRGFQAKRGFPVTGEVDRRTLDRLHEMTSEPTRAELTNQPTTNAPGALDPRCRTGRVLCVDKTSSTLRWVVDGEVRKSVDVRFGSQYTPTREGVFSVYRKSRDHVSSLYDTPMPYALFFSGGQAVHYSADFAAVGYAGASHGCVNVRDLDAVAWLFDQVQVGDRVVVYWA